MVAQREQAEELMARIISQVGLPEVRGELCYFKRRFLLNPPKFGS